MKKLKKQKNKVQRSVENNLAECMKYVIPLAVIGPIVLLLIGFVILQIQNMYSGDWISFKDNVLLLGALAGSYLLGSAPKEGLLTKFW